MSIKLAWRPVTKKYPCPICESTDWCQIAENAVIMCMRAQSGGILKSDKNGTTYRVFKMTEAKQNRQRFESAPRPEPKKRSASEWKNIARQHQTAITDTAIKALAKVLEVSEKSLRMYGIGLDVGGYDGKTGTKWYTFPMYGGDGKICGMRTRSIDGKKMSVPGSSNGLFVPIDYSGDAIPEGVCNDEQPLLLILPEGPTSAAACFDLGFRAIGRPNNSSGGPQLAELLKAGSPQDVVIIADDEGTKYTGGIPYWPGWEGAVNVAGKIWEACGRLRVCRLKDDKGNRIKDPREWLKGKHPLETIIDIFSQSQFVDAKWIRAKHDELILWKKRLMKPQ